MRILSNNQGLSRIEVVSIVGISCIAAALAVALGWYALSLMWQGNDANTLNTAESVAAIHSTAACLVPDCPGGSDAAHQKHLAADGSSVAYYGKGANKLVADPPAGYNEGDTLTVDGKEQHVARNSMIVKATAKDGRVVCAWVEAGSSS